jgi:hypothetical protein
MDSKTIVKRYRQLEMQRKSLDSVLDDIDMYVVPYRGEFFSDLTSEHEVRWKRTRIFDSTAIVACNLLASQMHGNLTSPVTKWFHLRFKDDDLNREPDAKGWLEDVSRRIWRALQESDFNNTAAEMYKDICSFGTAVIMAEEKNDLEWEGIDFTALPIMDSYFEMGPDGIPYRIYRRLRYTRLELEQRFPDLPDELDLDDVEESDVDAKIEVVFCVYKRDDVDDQPQALLPPEKRPIGYKYCLLNSSTKLEEGGYYQYPGMVVRWDKVAGAKWGSSPAMDLLSDIKQLNELVAQTSEARAKALDPPYITTERGVIGDLDLESGGVTVVTDMDMLKPLIPASDFVQADTERLRLQEAIRAGFFIDKLEFKDSPQMTATEVNMRYERMLRMMSPTLGRLQADFLDPLVEIMYGILARHQQLPEMPAFLIEREGVELDIEYIGPMPRAQKAEVAMSIEAWMMGIANLAQIFPEMLDNVDTDAVVSIMRDLRGVPADCQRGSRDVEQIRAERAEQQEAMELAQRMQAGGEAAEAMGKGAQAVQESGVEMPA